MLSSIKIAAVATALLGEAVYGATMGHAHLHKKSPDAPTYSTDSVDEVEEFAYTSLGVLKGANADANSADIKTWGAALGYNSDSQYQIEFKNTADEAVVVALWGGPDQTSCYDNQFITVNQSDVTFSLAVNESQVISINPSFYGTQMSGSFQPIYKSKSFKTWFGLINDTMGEFTYQVDDIHSTIDVSQLINVDGSVMSIDVYGNGYNTDNSAVNTPTCVSNATQCVFQCFPKSLGTCYNNTVTNCDGLGNGCETMTEKTGYSVVSLYGWI